MMLQNWNDDNRAVSPVIGVILMVAITVILAAVIGTFVLGLGDQLQDTTPRASFGFETADEKQRVSITHESGDTVAAADLEVKATTAFSYAGDTTANTQSVGWATVGSSGDVSAGTSVTIEAGAWNDTADDGDFAGHTIRVVYSSADAASSSTLAKYEVSS